MYLICALVFQVLNLNRQLVTLINLKYFETCFKYFLFSSEIYKVYFINFYILSSIPINLIIRIKNITNAVDNIRNFKISLFK